jgi:hypothetical protein
VHQQQHLAAVLRTGTAHGYASCKGIRIILIWQSSKKELETIVSYYLKWNSLLDLKKSIKKNQNLSF